MCLMDSPSLWLSPCLARNALDSYNHSTAVGMDNRTWWNITHLLLIKTTELSTVMRGISVMAPLHRAPCWFTVLTTDSVVWVADQPPTRLPVSYKSHTHLSLEPIQVWLKQRSWILVCTSGTSIPLQPVKQTFSISVPFLPFLFLSYLSLILPFPSLAANNFGAFYIQICSLKRNGVCLFLFSQLLPVVSF